MSNTGRMVVRTVILTLAIMAALAAIWFPIALIERHVFGLRHKLPPSTFLPPLLIAFAALAPDRWFRLPIRWSMRGSAVIAAPPDVVWEIVEPRPRPDPWQASIARIEAGTGTNEIVYVFEASLSPGNGEPIRIENRVEELEPGNRVVLRRTGGARLPLFGDDVASQEIRLEVVQGGTRLTLIKRFSGVRPSALLAFVHVNAVEEAVGRVKALVEGEMDRSWVARAMDDVVSDGQGPAQAGRDFAVIGGTVFATLAAIAIALAAIALT